MLLADTYTGMDWFTFLKESRKIEGGVGAFIIIYIKLVQPAKATVLMLVRLSGKVSEAKLVQPAKADMPMLVRLSGKVSEAKLVQPAKAPCLMLVRPSGRVIEDRPKHW